MSTQSRSRLRASLLIGLALSGGTVATVGLINSTVLQAQAPATTVSEKESERLERQDLFRLKMEEQRLLNSVGESHPQTSSIRRQIELIKKQIEAVREAERAQVRKSQRDADALQSETNVRAERKPQIAEGASTLPSGYSNSVAVPAQVYLNQPFGLNAANQEAVPHGSFGHPLTQPVRAAPNEEARELQAAYEAIRSEESDEKTKDESRAKIVEILSKQFDADLEQRTKQIEQLEKQIISLKEQMTKRRTAKDRLIELRIELMLNEGEGLGFPNAWQQPMRGSVAPVFPGAGFVPATVSPYSSPTPSTNTRR